MKTERNEYDSVEGPIPIDSSDSVDYRTRCRQLCILCIVMSLHSISFAMLFPVYPHLILQFFNGDTGKSSQFMGLLVSIVSIIKLFSNPIWGSLSDTFGRKKFLVLALLCHTISWTSIGAFPSISMLVVSKSALGAMDSVYTMAYSMVGDASGAGLGSDQTTKSFGLIGVAFGIGLIVGPGLGGYVAKIHPQLPFYVSSILTLVSALISLFFLQESLSPTRRQKFCFSRATPLPALRLIFRSKPLLMLAIPMFLAEVAASIHNIWYLYTNYRYGWNEMRNGIFLSYIGLLIAIVQGGLIRFIPKYIAERSAILLGIFMFFFSHCLIGLAKKGWMIYPIAMISSLHGIANPSLRTIATEFVDVSDQGTLQGGIMSITTLAMMCGSPFFGYLFKVSVSDSLKHKFPATCPEGYNVTYHADTTLIDNCGGLPAIPFFVDGAILLVAFILFALIFYKILNRAATSKEEHGGKPIVSYQQEILE